MGKSVIEKVIDGKVRYFIVDEDTAEVKEIHIDDKAIITTKIYQEILADAFKIIKSLKK